MNMVAKLLYWGNGLGEMGQHIGDLDMGNWTLMWMNEVGELILNVAEMDVSP